MPKVSRLRKIIPCYVKLLEKYLKLLDQFEGEKGLDIPLPTGEDIELVDRLTTALNEAKEAGENVWVPTDDHIEKVDMLTTALNEARKPVKMSGCPSRVFEGKGAFS